MLTEIDPRSGSFRLGTAIGGNTVAYIDLSAGNGDVYAYDLAASPPGLPQLISASPIAEQNPNVAPDGNTIVWEQCPSSLVNCDVFKAVRTGSSWTVSPVANTSDPEGNPDTDGTWIVYDANLTGNPTGQDIYYQPVSGGPATRLTFLAIKRTQALAAESSHSRAGSTPPPIRTSSFMTSLGIYSIR